MGDEYRHMRTYGHPNVKYYKPLGKKRQASDTRNRHNTTGSSFRNKSKPKEVAWNLTRDLHQSIDSGIDPDEIISKYNL
jgi:hypothetical protein